MKYFLLSVVCIFLMGISFRSSAQVVSLSSDGKTVSAHITSATPITDLRKIAVEIQQYNMQINLTSFKYNDDGTLRNIAFTIYSGDQKQSYANDDLASSPNGVWIVLNGYKTEHPELCAGSCGK